MRQGVLGVHVLNKVYSPVKGNKSVEDLFRRATAETSRLQVQSKGSDAELRVTFLSCTDQNLAQVQKVEPTEEFICSQGQVLLVLVT